MADDVAVCEVGDHEVVLAQSLGHFFHHLGQGQLRLLVKVDALGGGDAHVVLSGEGGVFPAVEEEGHVGELLRLGTVELTLAGLGEHLGQRLCHMGRRKSHRQVLKFVVIKGQNGKIEVVELVPGYGRKVRLGEKLRQLDFPLAPAAAEDHRISVLYAAYGGACFIHTHKGLHVVIAFASGIGGPDCLGQLNAAPALLFHHSRILLTKW